jgi:hypothetical protein
LTQVLGDVAEEPAGSDSELEPGVPVAANGSLPEAMEAPPDSVQPPDSKSPAGDNS